MKENDKGPTAKKEKLKIPHKLITKSPYPRKKEKEIFTSPAR